MILTLNLSAAETTAVQAQTDAFNAALVVNAALLNVKASAPLTVEEFLIHHIQTVLLDRFVSLTAEDQQNAFVASVLALPPDKRAEIDTIVQANVVTPLPPIAVSPVQVTPTAVVAPSGAVA